MRVEGAENEIESLKSEPLNPLMFLGVIHSHYCCRGSFMARP